MTSTQKKAEFQMGLEHTTLYDLLVAGHSGGSMVSNSEMWVFD